MHIINKFISCVKAKLSRDRKLKSEKEREGQSLSERGSPRHISCFSTTSAAAAAEKWGEKKVIMPTKSFIRHPIMQPGLHSTSGPHMPHCVARWREWVGITKAVRLPLCLTAKGSRRRHHKCLHMKCSGRGMHFSCGIEIKHREHRKKKHKTQKKSCVRIKNAAHWICTRLPPLPRLPPPARLPHISQQIMMHLKNVLECVCTTTIMGTKNH